MSNFPALSRTMRSVCIRLRPRRFTRAVGIGLRLNEEVEAVAGPATANARKANGVVRSAWMFRLARWWRSEKSPPNERKLEQRNVHGFRLRTHNQ